MLRSAVRLEQSERLAALVVAALVVVVSEGGIRHEVPGRVS